MLASMENIESLSKQQLLELVGQQQEELASSQEELATSQKELARAKDITRQLEEKNCQLEKDYLKLFRERFGRKSERYIADANQLRLDFGDTDDAADAADGLAEAVEDAGLEVKGHTRRRRKKKHEFPAHLPRFETIVDVDETDKVCSQHGDKQLLPEAMWDVREKLVLIPAKLEVHVSKYKQYACQNQPQCGIASAERPTGIVESNEQGHAM